MITSAGDGQLTSVLLTEGFPISVLSYGSPVVDLGRTVATAKG